MADFAKLALTAKRLIDANGRTITIRRLSRVEDDPAKPWRGTTDVRTTPDAVVSIKGVFVHPDSAIELGIRVENPQLVSELKEIAIVEAQSITDDLTTFDEVVDGTELYKIIKVEKLKPGEITLLYFLFLKQ